MFPIAVDHTKTVQHIKIPLGKEHTEEFVYVFCSQGIASVRNVIFTPIKFLSFSYADFLGLYFISWFGLDFLKLKKKGRVI